MSNAEFPHLSHEEDDDLAVGRREGQRDGRTDGVKWSLDLMEESGDGRRTKASGVQARGIVSGINEFSGLNVHVKMWNVAPMYRSFAARRG